MKGAQSHSWADDGWTPFTEIVATADDPQVFAATVEGGRGRVTGPEAPGNHRVWYLRDATSWADSRITSVWWPPNVWQDSPTRRPQMGHVHTAQHLASGHWVGIVAWYNILGTPGEPAALVVNGWDVDGTNLLTGDGGGAGEAQLVNRQGIVVRASHVSFGAELGVYRVVPAWAAKIDVGTPVTVSGMSDPDYDVSDVVSQSAPGDINVTVELPSAPTAALDPIASGTLTPDLPWSRMPYMVSSELRQGAGDGGGHLLRVKQWAYGMPVPDWSDQQHVSETTITVGDMEALPSGPGRQGIMIGHAWGGDWAEIGDILFEQI